MKYDRLWERLLAFLNEWTTATVVAPGRIELTLASPATRSVEIVMTPDQWDDMVSIPWGNFADAAQEVQKSVLALRDDETFLVYGDYELVPSSTSELPPDPEDALLEELARKHPEGFGRWVVMDDDGNVLDELGPRSD